MKKKTLFASMVAICIAVTAVAENTSTGDQNTQSGFGFSLGERTLRLTGTTFSHNTYPADYFLPNASIPGSAGTTTLNGENYFATIGINYAHPIESISRSLSWRTEFGALIGYNEDQHENANDHRPPANGAFVYSDAIWGGYGQWGITYHLGNHLYVGLDVEGDVVFLDNGWNRYSTKTTQKMNEDWIVAGGPALGYDFNNQYGIEVNGRLGNAWSIGGKFNWKF